MAGKSKEKIKEDTTTFAELVNAGVNEEIAYSRINPRAKGKANIRRGINRYMSMKSVQNAIFVENANKIKKIGDKAIKILDKELDEILEQESGSLTTAQNGLVQFALNNYTIPKDDALEVESSSTLHNEIEDLSNKIFDIEDLND